MKAVCVFGSSSESIDKEYLDSAEHLGKSLPNAEKPLCSAADGTGSWALSQGV